VISTVASQLEQSGRGWLFGRIMSDIDGMLKEEGYVAPRFSYGTLLRRNFIPHPATFVRRDLMMKTGGFDPRFKYAMDYDMWLKLARQALPVQLDEPLAAFRVHQGSLSSSNRLAAMEEDFKVRLSHIGPNPIARAMHTTRYLVRKHRLLDAA
jgi:hypothetical protein